MEKLLLIGDYYEETGWFKQDYPRFETQWAAGMEGQSPEVRYKITNGAEGPQGFLYYLFYQPGSAISQYPGKPQGIQLNRCMYNYCRETEVTLRCDPPAPLPVIVHKSEHHKESLRYAEIREAQHQAFVMVWDDIKRGRLHGNPVSGVVGMDKAASKAYRENKFLSPSAAAAASQAGASPAPESPAAARARPSKQ